MLSSPYKAADDLPSTGYVRLPQLLKIFPVSRSTLLGWVTAGKFPRPHKIGARAVAWRVEDVRAYLAERAETDRPDPNSVKAMQTRMARRAEEKAKAARRALLI